MMLDPANSDKSEALLYVEALGGRSMDESLALATMWMMASFPLATSVQWQTGTRSTRSSKGQSEKRYFSAEEVQEVADRKDERMGMQLPPGMVPSMMMSGVNSLQPGLPFSIETGQPSVVMPGVPNLQSGEMSSDETVSQSSMLLPAMPNVNGFPGIPNINAFLGIVNVNGIPGHNQLQANATPALQNGMNWMQPNGYFTSLLSTTSKQ